MKITDIHGSSQIAAAGYDEAKSEFSVRFTATPAVIYTYEKVPRSVFDEFMQSSSKGSFFHKNVKGKFTFRTSRA